MYLNFPTPELPVADVEKAQVYYRDILGCKIEWMDPSKEIGAVSNGDTPLFFRKRNKPFQPAVHWVFIEDIDTAYAQLVKVGATIIDELEDKPWGMRQFSIADLDGNVFTMHHDL